MLPLNLFSAATAAAICLAPSVVAGPTIKYPTVPHKGSVQIITDNNYQPDAELHTWLLVNDKKAIGSAACIQFNETLTSVPTDLIPTLVASVKKNASPSLGKLFRVASTASTSPYKPVRCSALSLSGSFIVTVPCNTKLPTLCTNTAPRTTLSNFYLPAPATILAEVGSVGSFVGYRDAHSFRFLSVPYASAPIGKLRFTPPKAAPKAKALLTTKQPSLCPTNSLDDSWIQSEDCLFLNIYTPRLGGLSDLPVVVWIPGGGFLAGGIGKTETEAGRFASRNNVVVVALQYRLGFLGTYVTNKTTSSNPGNLNIRDQIFALQWIRANIPYFSGVPSAAQTVILGESAGAVSVRALLSSPLTQTSTKLFTSAILQSDTAGAPWTTKQGQIEVTESILKALGCGVSDIECARQKTHQEISAAQAVTGATLFGPMIDGVVITDHFHNLLKKGSGFNKSPAIWTSLNNDAGLFVSAQFPDPVPGPYAFALLAQQFNSTDLATAVLANPVYQFDMNSADARLSISLVVNDLQFACPSRYLARALEAAGGSARVAEWVVGKRILGLEGVLNPTLCNDEYFCHIDDLLLTFGGSHVYHPLPQATLSPAQLSALRDYSDRIVRFAKTQGKDAGSGWTGYGSGAGKGLEIGGAGVKEGWMPECDLWDYVGAYAFLKA
ncbi:hypothetical protein HK097_002881 [Rhizophlyctis rosea]|uniref:Carboxylesterase type B domain-containing protein n=1 Tax=Rhizophlyctis rosea TaxID=64517 RepID=A0AAD5SG63_9FUNG|nr:hypothetical protein HK097_002881 [Rhizophlyctis rosea]